MTETPAETPASPLSIPDESSLAEIIAKDPLQLTDLDVEKIVVYYRNNTHLWEKEKKVAKREGRRPNYNRQALKKVKLDDLDI